MRAMWMERMRPAVLALLGVSLLAAGCASPYEEEVSMGRSESELAAQGNTAPEGQRRNYSLAGQQASGNTIQVNGFLWRAALDTVSFMPINTADPYGGAILTDWHSPEGADDERFKLNILVQGEEIRSDGVRVTVFKQKRSPDGQWRDEPADTNTALDFENLILVRARELRQSFLAE